MTRQHVARTPQSSKSETPLVSALLPRAAVCSIPETAMQPQEDMENSTSRESRFHHDFSRVPVHSTTPIIQPQLRIGAVGDKYEQEADWVARQVVSQIHAPGNQTVQRKEMPDKDDEEKLNSKLMVQRQSDGSDMAATPQLEASIQQARGNGHPLADNIRKPMEQAFGFDFSHVKVHTDAQSERLNRCIQAKAFTTGQDIFFRQGAYSPGSRGGQELIAHELTHVVQQNQRRLKPTMQSRARVTNEEVMLEQETDLMGDRDQDEAIRLLDINTGVSLPSLQGVIQRRKWYWVDEQWKSHDPQDELKTAGELGLTAPVANPGSYPWEEYDDASSASASSAASPASHPFEGLGEVARHTDEGGVRQAVRKNLSEGFIKSRARLITRGEAVVIADPSNQPTNKHLSGDQLGIASPYGESASNYKIYHASHGDKGDSFSIFWVYLAPYVKIVAVGEHRSSNSYDNIWVMPGSDIPLKNFKPF